MDMNFPKGNGGKGRKKKKIKIRATLGSEINSNRSPATAPEMLVGIW